MSSGQSASAKKPSRGAGRGGRGRGSGGRRGAGAVSVGFGSGNRLTSGAKRPTSRDTRSHGNSVSSMSGDADSIPSMRDEEVLIAFMPFLKGDNQEAISIHESYQADNDQQAFLRSAREFLTGVQAPPNSFGVKDDTKHVRRANSISSVVPGVELPPSVSPRCGSIHDRHQTPLHFEGKHGDAKYAALAEVENPPSPPRSAESSELQQLQNSSLNQLLQSQPGSQVDIGDIGSAASEMKSLERKMLSLLSDDDDPVIAMPNPVDSFASAATIGSVGSSPARINSGDAGFMFSSLTTRSHQRHTVGQRIPLPLPQPDSFAPHNISRPLHQPQHPQIPRRVPMHTSQSTDPAQPAPSRFPSFLPSSSSLGNNTGSPSPPPIAFSQQVNQHAQSFPTTLQSNQLLDGAVSGHGSRSPWEAMTPPSGLSVPSTPGSPRIAFVKSVSFPGQPHQQQITRHRHTGVDPQRKEKQLQVAPEIQATATGTKTNAAASVPGPGNSPAHDMVQSNGATVSSGAEKPPTSAKKEYQPKRLWTRFGEQPGRLLANGVPASDGAVLELRPRQELTAKWMLPLSYLRRRTVEKQNGKTIRDALSHLAVGLFRRGCTENGAHASIISKEVCHGPHEHDSGNRSSDYPFQVINDTVVGTVPFYSPRTPGHVVFRLYWQDQPLTTLATGPTLNVRVTEDDFESSIRFILSNFKAKKVNPTSLSSLNSLVLVLEQFDLPGLSSSSDNCQQQQQQQQLTQRVQQHLDGAGRAVWGCICEARKVLEACAADYAKTTAKLHKLEEAVDELKAKAEEESGSLAGDGDSHEHAGGDHRQQEQESGADQLVQEPLPSVLALREKQKALMSGRASCERKWRDSQLAFASILKAVVSNTSISVLLRRDLITKMRLEFELWCPLCEEFAIPASGGDSDGNMMWYEPLANLGHPITVDDFRMCREARSKMQVRILGFEPNKLTLASIVYPQTPRVQGSITPTPQMSPAAVSVLNQLSGAMGQLYQDLYTTADKVHVQREYIRSQMEKFVGMCDEMPHGTKVVVFGSAANGFGSPKSDLDMCLQLPQGASAGREEDPTGAQAMAKLAKILEANGMQEVDTGRLTARIPVVKFKCPKPKAENEFDGEDALMECDLSMHNPLAVLNTSLLRTYAEINPVTRVLAAIVKRWAKARDINNPSRHTLSSYGYILMLLHFLTFHERCGNGLVSPIAGPEGPSSNQRRPRGVPLLPNLQWMDNKWPNSPAGTPYRELQMQPRNLMHHPLEEKSVVNAYFYVVNGRAELRNLQRLFPDQDLSLSILLASFFRYYAYEFDYKRHVVSLHSTYSRGLVEREVKAELDGWRNYSAALTIEDPFETFYDVAHVLRGGYYHRIRREFAVAYSKIADAATGVPNASWTLGGAGGCVNVSSITGRELIDWICEPVSNEREETSV